MIAFWADNPNARFFPSSSSASTTHLPPPSVDRPAATKETTTGLDERKWVQEMNQSVHACHHCIPHNLVPPQAHGARATKRTRLTSTSDLHSDSGMMSKSVISSNGVEQKEHKHRREEHANHGVIVDVPIVCEPIPEVDAADDTSTASSIASTKSHAVHSKVEHVSVDASVDNSVDTTIDAASVDLLNSKVFTHFNALTSGLLFAKKGSCSLNCPSDHCEHVTLGGS